MRTEERKLTSVAEIPGYPTRKLLFGGPETRTLAGAAAAAAAAILALTLSPDHSTEGYGRSQR